MNDQNKTYWDAFERVEEARKDSLADPTVTYLRALEAQVAEWHSNIRAVLAVVEARERGATAPADVRPDDPSLD